MEFETLVYTVDGPKVRIGLNRPKAINAINCKMKYELRDAFLQAGKEPGARVIILYNEGKNFSSGIDLKDMEWEHSPAGYGEHFDACIAGARAMWDCDLPIICKVKGYALGGGLDYVLAADYVLSADTARLGCPEIMMGAFAPTLMLPWVINMKKAREVLAMGVELSAKEAMDCGIVNRIFPEDQLDAEVEKWADQIINIPKNAATMAKKSINYQYELMGMWEGIQHNREMSVVLNVIKTREERAAFLKMIREGGLKDLLKKLADNTLVHY